MNFKLIAAATVLSICASVGAAQAASSAPAEAAHYSHGQLKQMMHDAHTPERYNTLATYFASQRQEFLKQAAEEKLEWERRSQNVVSVAAKYPRPVDSARNLYEYYIQEAAEAEAISAKYTRLLASPQGAGSVQ